MLRLTGEKADGWLPSQSYIDMSALAELNARRCHRRGRAEPDLLERVDEAMLALVTNEDDGMAKAPAVMDLFTDALLSHLSYEERELVEPLARLGFY
jgi:hypothetical protein